MSYYDYTDINTFLHDKDLKDLLSTELSLDELLVKYTKEDFLELNDNVRVPFFAETRGYTGATEKENPSNKWIAKPALPEDILPVCMASVVYFLDFFTKTVSAPALITTINGKLYRVSKLVSRAEQLSGANYMEIPQLKDQLILDLINRWIYCDEDRNPNNYMIKYNSKNTQVVIAIDFSNVDLISETYKIKGLPENFGWERKEKTRYLTPLKTDSFLEYSIDFYNQRINAFKKVDSKLLQKICDSIIKFSPELSDNCKIMNDNILKRIDYVTDYFSKYIPKEIKDMDKDKYGDMGSTFLGIYNK